MNSKSSTSHHKIKQRKIREEKKARRKKRQTWQLSKKTAKLKTASGHSGNFKRAVLVSVIVGASFLFSINQFQHPNSNFCVQSVLGGMSSKKLISLLTFNPYALSNKPSRKTKSKLHQQIISIIKNTPMEKMTDKISERERPVAAFLVGIAMKESKFGKYSPKKDGVECYNYWGYRGKENTTKSGYSCFASPEEAVRIVGNKIATIVKLGVQHPEQMISWKCGRTCAGHSPESVDKWIQDVSINYYRLNPIKQLAKK